MEQVRRLGKIAAVKMRALGARLRTQLNLLPALSMRHLLAMLVLLTAIPLLALALLMSSRIVATEGQANRSVLMSNVRTLAALVDNEIETHLAIASTLATSPSLQTGDIRSFRQQAIPALAAVPGSWIVLSDPSGRQVMSTLLAEGEPLPPRNSLDFLRQVWSSGKPQVSDVVMGSVTKRYNAIVELPVFKDGEPLYSIIVGLNPDRFLAIIRDNFSPDSVVGLLDRQAKFVARIPDHAARVGTPASNDWRAAMVRSSEGFTETTTLEGEASLTPYVKTKHGWTVGIAYLKRVTDAPARRLLWTLALIGGALTLLSLTLAFGLARRINVSMQSLMDASQAISGGKTVAPRQLAVHEATEISRTLSVTSEILATRTADLTRAHDTFLNLIEHAPFGVYIVDSDFCVSQISLGAVKAFANVQPVLGRDFAEVMRAIWPEKFAEDAISRFRHTLETGEPYHQSSLEEIRRDTGDDEAYDWQIERVTLPDGNFGVVCYYYDFTALKSAQAQLRESEIRFRQTFENAAVGVAHVGLEGQLLQVNQTLCSLLGYSVEELQTKTFQDITHPDDLNADLDNVRRLIAAEIQNYGMDKRFIRKDGGSIWVGLTVALRRDTAGAPLYFISVVRDISGRKAAQAHQEFLLNELAHRMKNQLSVIQSMAAQTARNAGSLKQFQEKFSERVQGLAVATDLLVSQRWTGAQLTELIQRQLMPFIPSADQLECNGPNVSISADATQTLGLALHELATNAVKHGAWSASGGRVSVSWQFVTNGATGNNLRVTWLEQGGPAVLPPTRKGFGHVVIEKVAAQRVGGEASLVFAPEGLIWTLTMPNRHIVNAAE